MRMNRRPSYQPPERKEVVVSKAGKLITKSMKPPEKTNKVPVTKGEKINALIGEDPSVDTVTGKLPVEAAYVTMKRVISESGLQVNPQGLSVFNKLQSFPTEPALEVLQKQTWREFFAKTSKHRPRSAASSHHSGSRRPQSANSNTTSKEELLRHQEEMKQYLYDIFAKLISRVEELWMTTKIPIADQKFYRQSLLRGPPHSLDQCKEISCYIYMLREHHAATLLVLQSVQIREEAVTKCYDVLAALQRKFSKIISGQGREYSVPGLANSHSSIQSGRVDVEATVFWKEELINALDDVRSATLVVIRSIQMWRRNLWRPKPFVWCGINYILKIKDDLRVLETDMYMRLLEMVPLNYEDLLCIVFFPPDRMMLRSTSTSGNHTPGRAPSPPNTGKKGRPDTMLSASGQQLSVGSSGPGSGLDGNANGAPGNLSGADEYIQSLLHEFVVQVDRTELQAAAAVVLEEETLQNAMLIERSALEDKGVFIPTLKLQPATNVLKERTMADDRNGTAPSTEGTPAKSNLQSIKSRRSGGKKASADEARTGMRKVPSLASHNSQYSADFSDREVGTDIPP